MRAELHLPPVLLLLLLLLAASVLASPTPQRRIVRLTDQDAKLPAGASVLTDLRRHGVHGAVLDLAQDAAAMQRAFPDLEWHEDRSLRLDQSSMDSWAQPSDYGSYWAVDRINQRFLPRDGSYSSGQTISSEPATVFLLDSLVDTTHRLLAPFAPRILQLDFGLQLPAAPLTGKDYVHGTAVAAALLLASPRTSIVSLRVTQAGGQRVLESDLIMALEHVLVVDSQRLGGRPCLVLMAVAINDADDFSPVLVDLLAKLYAADIPVVLSGGNRGLAHCPMHRHIAPYSIAVGALDKLDQAWSGSSHCVDLYAPGVEVLLPDASRAVSGDGAKDVAWFTGSSVSAPFVAAILSMWMERAPDASAARAKQFLLDQATHLYSVGTGGAPRLLYWNGYQRFTCADPLGLSQDVNERYGNAGLCPEAMNHDANLGFSQPVYQVAENIIQANTSDLARQALPEQIFVLPLHGRLPGVTGYDDAPGQPMLSINISRVSDDVSHLFGNLTLTRSQDSALLTLRGEYEFCDVNLRPTAQLSLWLDRTVLLDSSVVVLGRRGRCCNGGCTLTRTHYAENITSSALWRIDPETGICGRTWSSVMRKRTGAVMIEERHNLWTPLAQHYITARLNIERGACAIRDLETVLVHTRDLLELGCINRAEPFINPKVCIRASERVTELTLLS